MSKRSFFSKHTLLTQILLFISAFIVGFLVLVSKNFVFCSFDNSCIVFGSWAFLIVLVLLLMLLFIFLRIRRTSLKSEKQIKIGIIILVLLLTTLEFISYVKINNQGIEVNNFSIRNLNGSSFPMNGKIGHYKYNWEEINSVETSWTKSIGRGRNCHENMYLILKNGQKIYITEITNNEVNDFISSVKQLPVKTVGSYENCINAIPAPLDAYWF